MVLYIYMYTHAYIYVYTAHAEPFRVSELPLYPSEVQSKKISNDQELIQSDPISCPQNQKVNN